MSFGDRLREARTAMGYTQEQLAALIGVAKSTLTGYEKGNREPDVMKIKKLSQALAVSPDFLIETDGRTREKPITPQGQRIGRAYDKATTPVQKTVEVALEPYMDEHKPHLYVEPAEEEDKVISLYTLDLPASAGIGIYLDDESGEMVDYPARVVPPGTDCAICIDGNSMEPDIPDGAVAFVKYQHAIEAGQIGIFVYDNEPTGFCKRFRRDFSGKTFLESSNKSYDPIYLDDEEEKWRVFGRVLGVYTGE